MYVPMPSINWRSKAPIRPRRLNEYGTLRECEENPLNSLGENPPTLEDFPQSSTCPSSVSSLQLYWEYNYKMFYYTVECVVLYWWPRTFGWVPAFLVWMIPGTTSWRWRLWTRLRQQWLGSRPSTRLRLAEFGQASRPTSTGSSQEASWWLV